MSKLYGIGVGPGDPELLTIKAVNAIKKSNVIIAIQSKKSDNSLALSIVEKAGIDLSLKEVICLIWPMSKDQELLSKFYEKTARKIANILEQKKTVGYLVLGDPCVFGTYMKLHSHEILAKYDKTIVNGITSFCAAAAQLKISLAEGSQSLHILPASYDLSHLNEDNSTKVFMKSASKLKEVTELLSKTRQNVYAAENVGLPAQKLHFKLEEIPSNSGYFTIVIQTDN